MDGPPAGDPSEEYDGRDAIVRVALPWPARTKVALLSSLDCGTFEDVRVAAPSGFEPAEQLMYFAGAVDRQVASTILRRKPSDYHEAELITDSFQLLSRSLPPSPISKFPF